MNGICNCSHVNTKPRICIDSVFVFPEVLFPFMAMIFVSLYLAFRKQGMFQI